MTRKVLSLFALALVACGATPDEVGQLPEPDAERSAESLDDGISTYYIVTRQDMRKCMYPMCGGYFVKRVNRALTRCTDGVWRQECHAVDVDLSALGMSESVTSEYVSGTFGAGKGLIRGKLVSENGADTLVGSEAWVGRAGAEPSGGVWRVESSGIVCITWPCPSYKERLLNHGYGRYLHGVDLATSGAGKDAIAEGYDELGTEGALVAGYHWGLKGPGGWGIELRASEFYTRLSAGSYCATTYVMPPYSNSPTFYAKNFTSEKDGWAFLNQSFPHGENSQVIEGPCNQPRPCIKVFKPVCGVIKDSAESTYGNSCEFEAALMADAGDSGESKGFYSEGVCKPVCDYTDPNRKYVAQSPEQCQTVKFFCDSGTPFFDECGCGCEQSK